MSMEKMKLFIRADDLVRHLKAELEEAKSHRTKLLEECLEWFGEEGVQSMRVDDRTYYLHRSTYAAKAVEDMPSDELVRVICALGYEDFAPQRVNWQRLSAFFREREKQHEPAVPEKLDEYLRLDERFDIRSRKA